MSLSDYNQSKAIAALMCPLLRSRSPKVPFRCLAADSDEMFHTAVQMLQLLGVRKGFFQSRRKYVIESLLFTEYCFETAHSILELDTTVPIKGAWTGAGEFKETSASDGMMLSSVFDAVGMAPMGPSALIEIDISAIWPQISPLLERQDPTERAAERHRQQMAALECVPNYEGPPATPEQAAKIERMLSEIRTGKKSNPNDRNA
jgi:hypothetical protein